MHTNTHKHALIHRHNNTHTHTKMYTHNSNYFQVFEQERNSSGGGGGNMWYDGVNLYTDYVDV